MTSIFVAMILAVSPFDMPYCRGWEAGWKAGWCRDRAACLPLPAPPCPPPCAGRDKRDDGFTAGYDRALRERPKK